MTVRVEFSVHLIGDDPSPSTIVTAQAAEISPMTATVATEAGGTGQASTGQPLRVRLSGLSRADLDRLAGTAWAHGALDDPQTKRRLHGLVSALEWQDEGLLEFILSPTA